MAFQQAGITAIGLGQKPTDSSQRGIHTTEDNLENYFWEPVDTAYRILHDLVQSIIEKPSLLSS
ncbi:hypothetical protein [Cytobacillus firmus]|uniref:hypothetical protein n=1 Tax=Cytobacillus firmus TaxID=1399 RepID=UPI0004B6B971|nr:hypothetical protein [Cytobacillus firmus]